MTVTGLPLHPLVVHAVVVLLPLMALLTVLVAVRPAWRTKAWWVVVGNALVAGASLLAKESGESLQASLGGQVAREHGELGEVLPWFAIALLVTSAALALLRSRRTPALVSAVVTVVAAVAAVWWTVRTGDSGARAVWQR